MKQYNMMNWRALTQRLRARENIKTSIAYDIKGEEKTPRKSEKKEKSYDGYVHKYECGKHLLHSTY